MRIHGRLRLHAVIATVLITITLLHAAAHGPAGIVHIGFIWI